MNTEKEVKKIFRDPHYPKRSLMLLDQLMKGQITMPEFDCLCALWLLEDECWNSLQPEILHEKPFDMRNYEMMDETSKQKLDRQYFKDHPEIMRYADKKFFAYYHNGFRIEQLERFKKCFKKEEEEIVEEFNQKINHFRREMIKAGAQLGVIDCIEEDEGLQAIRDTFDGTIS